MKTKIKLLALLLFLLGVDTVQGQQTKRLAIGDQLPEVVLNHIYKGGPDEARPTDFRGKGILIDFWATWCGPCVASMGFLDSLQLKFKDQLQVVCVTSEDKQTVAAAYGRLFPGRAPSFLTLIRDTLLKKYFPHQTLPHCVWIDKSGRVSAITDKEEVTLDNVRDMLEGNAPKVKSKPATIRIDTHRPPYASGQLALKDEFLYHSLITRYREDLVINYSRGPKNDYIACTNSSIIRLYQCAFGGFDLSWLDMDRVVCEGFETFADSASIGLFKSDALINSWKSNIRAYAFTYETAVSDTVYTKDELFAIMGQDLNRYFGVYGLSARTEKRSRKVLALVDAGGRANRSFKGTGSAPERYADKGMLKVIGHRMAYFLSQLAPYLSGSSPLKNETGYEGDVSITLEFGRSSLDGINSALLEYGLKLVERDEPIDVIVVTKTKGKRSLI